MKFILGKKIEMSQLFDEKGDVIPVTLVQAGPCTVIQIKKEDKDGYLAVQIGFDKKKKLSKALKGHLKGLEDFRFIKEFRTDDQVKRGDNITVDIFNVGDKVKVTANSKGKGFQGVVKRHGFHGSPATHGHKDQLRMPGSIGASEPARVFEGMRMPGHMGAERVTVKNLAIAKIDSEKNILYIKGAVPGARGSLVMIQGEGELKINQKEVKEVEKVDKGKKGKESPETRLPDGQV